MEIFKRSMRRSSVISVIVVMVALLLAACGGSSEPVPHVVGMTLDHATDDVEDAGYTVETFGGGTFGPLDESGWVVCEQNPAAGATEAEEVELTVKRDCDEESAASADQSETEETEESEETEAAAKPKPKFQASSVDWEALDESRLKVMFTVKNKSQVAGRPKCFVEIDARDINDECFGECGAQDILTGKKLRAGEKIRTFGIVNVQGGAAPAVYDVTVLC